MHVELGGYHVGDVEVVAAFDVDARRSGGRGRGDLHRAEQHDPLRRRLATGGRRESRTHAGRPRAFYRDVITESDERGDVVGVLATEADVLVSYRWVRGGRPVLRACAIDAGVGFVNCLLRSSPSDPAWAKEFGDAGRFRSSATTSSRRSARRSRTDAREAVRGPRSRARSHVPAELRRQHGLHEHARALPADLEEDLEDAVGPVAVGRPLEKDRIHIARRTTCRGSRTASGR